MRRLGAAPAIAAALLIAAATSSAGADSITPVALTIRIAAVARLHQPLSVTVGVSADPSVLDTRTAPLRIRVKLAGECGGEFPDTSGTTLLDQQLSPQPAAGQPYAASATGSGKPSAYGVQTVCVYLEEEGDNRQFATDTSEQVVVSKPCTTSAARYDRVVRMLARARRRLRRDRHAGHGVTKDRRAVAKDRRVVAKDRRVARRTCGPGVRL